jgi:hypothetical protein
MAKSQPKISLSVSRDIPFNKLVLSRANVRRIKAGVAIEELAEDIARHTLLQSLTVRPILDEGGAETGVYEVPAGGRRYRALELLVKKKRLARTAPIPCIVRTEGLAEEDSLAENVQRAPLHPSTSSAPSSRRLPRPRHQGPHPRRRARGQRRGRRPAHGPPEEGGDGDRSRGVARRHRLGARTAAHAGTELHPGTDAAGVATEATGNGGAAEQAANGRSHAVAAE